MTLLRRLAVAWAITGFSLLLGVALVRLTARTLEGFAYPFTWHHWLVLSAGVLFMAYTEGYRGFQLKFSPRFAGRVLALREGGTLTQCVLAPFYAMGFFAAPRRVVITAWLLTVMIVCLVLLLKLVPQPWRGIADAGVVIGLGWGLIATLWMTADQLRRRPDFAPATTACPESAAP
ncbi:MAG: hypothetical protein AAGI67_16060 [Pseudomonadota bacterium]